MGSIVQAWLGSEDGLLGHFATRPADVFAEWFLERASASPDPADADLLGLIERLQTRGHLALRAESEVEARLVDDLLQVYYGDFLSFHGKHFRRASESVLPERSYWAALSELASSPFGHPLLTLWKLVLAGRPIERDELAFPFNPSKPHFRLSFWSRDDCKLWQTHAPRVLRTTADGNAKDALTAISSAAAVALTAGVGLIFTVG